MNSYSTKYLHQTIPLESGSIWINIIHCGFTSISLESLRFADNSPARLFGHRRVHVRLGANDVSGMTGALDNRWFFSARNATEKDAMQMLATGECVLLTFWMTTPTFQFWNFALYGRM
ncbi:hypothetical protein PILCRDRAFT_329837 [Piloderma croceum F 1598]|uniref:Uncharacterized protein n=1 Tax=Piloderma croceum (strain F 1598) TaxID=765440 RepID=A0A0C3G5P3_PILCF|nr:hypothetical protein PILCRDRAFT_329837 [Piloderma croceum F 1598]